MFFSAIPNVKINPAYHISLAMVILLAASCGNNNTSPRQNIDARAVPGNADTIYNMSTDAGRTLFEQKCKVCHSMYGNAVDSRAANLQLTVLDSAAIAYTIKNGRKDMPGFLTMPDSEVDAITRYVLSIRK